jgi:two-component system chemotaxis response regulator CheY
MPDMQVLVVDDSSTMRRIVVKSLNKLQFSQVIEADNGAEALGKLCASTGLVITDWNMPEMNGLEFVKQVRSNPDYKSIPIVMVTTEAGKAEVLEAIKHGVNTYVVKPFTIAVLRDKLQSVLKVNLPAVN